MAMALAACGDDGSATKPVDASLAGIDASTDVRPIDATDAPISTIDAPDAPPPQPVLHDCLEGDYVFRAGVADDRTVAISGTKFMPKCVTIAVGQSLTITGDFGIHPLAPGQAPSYAGDPAGAPNSPITATTSGTTATFGPFPAAGYYPYYCPAHQVLGMVGVVRVVP